MHLYVVIGGEKEQKALAVFSTRERALTFVEERGVRNPLVQERPLSAGYAYPTDVYAAHELRPESDSLAFVDLFIDADEADAAAGERGMVLTLRPDNKAVEDIH